MRILLSQVKVDRLGISMDTKILHKGDAGLIHPGVGPGVLPGNDKGRYPYLHILLSSMNVSLMIFKISVILLHLGMKLKKGNHQKARED